MINVSYALIKKLKFPIIMVKIGFFCQNTHLKKTRLVMQTNRI